MRLFSASTSNAPGTTRGPLLNRLRATLLLGVLAVSIGASQAVGGTAVLFAAVSPGAREPVAHLEVPFVDGFTGAVGIYAAVVDPDADSYEELAVVRYGETRAFPLASTFKLFVLLEVMKAVDSGELDWRERLAILPEDWSLDSGRPRAQMTVSRLVRRMVKDSHNTSSDVLFKHVGLGSPAATLAGLSMERIRVTLPTREFWVVLAGLAPEVFPYDRLPASALTYASADRAEQIRQVEAVRDAGGGHTVAQIDTASNDFYRFRTWPRDTAFEILDDLDNAARPDDLVRYVHHLFLSNGLSERNDKRLRKVLASGDRAVDRRQIKVPLSYWGGKGGSDLGMGSMVGYGITKSGSHIIYAILGAHMTQERADWRILEDLLTWVFDTLAGRAPGR